MTNQHLGHQSIRPLLQTFSFLIDYAIKYVIYGYVVRFDKPCLDAKGALGYFRENLGIGDYLSEGQSARLTWYGQGADRLGLKGECDPADFGRLCAGRDPRSGEPLMVRDKGARRRVCFFGQISAPKDVSLACLVGGDRRIASWWDESVRATLAEIESATLTRVRKDSACADRPTGNLLAAVVTHDASRALDPQLHTHVCILNLTYDGAERRWKCVQPSAFYRRQGFFREVCHQKLAARLTAAGYILTHFRAGNFEIAGVPPGLRARFSKRRTAILAQAAQLGARSQDALQAITSRTRAAKRHLSPDELRERWEAEAGSDLAPLRQVVRAAAGRRKAAPGLPPAEALLSAERHLFERRSVVDEHELLRESLHAGRGDAELEKLRHTLDERIAEGSLLRIGANVASPAMLEAEREFLSWCRAGQDTCDPLGTVLTSARLDSSQQRAVASVLRSRDRVTVLLGDAGTGKTTCLASIVSGIESSGGRVFGCAPSAGAAEILRRELTPQGDTLQRWLVDQKLRQSTSGRTLVIDEAGLISVPQLRDLCRLAARHDNRLLLVGDPKQHHAVESGDALRALVKYGGLRPARLREIRRQRDPAYRAAVAHLAAGQPHEAFDSFDRIGAIREIPHEDNLHQEAAATFVRHLSSHGSCLALSPVWSEIESFTSAVRTQLRAAGRLGADERTLATFVSRHWTAEERRQVENYQPGDVLSFHHPAPGFACHELATVTGRIGRYLAVTRATGQVRWLNPKRVRGFEAGTLRELPVASGERLLLRANLKSSRLKNGDLVEVARLLPDGTIHLQDGRTIPPHFRQFTHGYATTSHSAQGKTVDHGILLMGEAGLRAGNLPQAYVSNSRFRLSQVIFTTDKAAARAAFARPGDRELVTEAIHLAAPQPAESARPRVTP